MNSFFNKVFVPRVESSSRVAGLDIMRFVAITFVLLAHSIRFLRLDKEVDRIASAFMGYLGVEIFFVLSGFLIGSIFVKMYDKSGEKFSFLDARNFWIRRWLRTLPAYYLILAIKLMYVYKTENHFLLMDVKYSSYLLFLQNSFSSHPFFFSVAWSLAVEEWFYLIFPVGVLVFNRIYASKKLSILACLFSLMVVFACLRTFVVAVWNPSWDAGVRKMMPLRLDSILMGVIAACFCHYYSTVWKRCLKPALALGLVFLLAAVTFLYTDVLAVERLTEQTFFGKTFLFSLFSLGLALLLPYFNSIKKIENLFVSRVVTHISLISYSLYLTHTMFITVFEKMATFPPLLTMTFFFLASIVCSTVLFTCFEHPLTNLRDRWTAKEDKEAQVKSFAA